MSINTNYYYPQEDVLKYISYLKEGDKGLSKHKTLGRKIRFLKRFEGFDFENGKLLKEGKELIYKPEDKEK